MAGAAPERGLTRGLLALALATGLLALAVDYFFAVPVYPGMHLFFGSVPILMLVLAGGWQAGLIASVVTGLGAWLLWGHPLAWSAYTLEVLAVGLLGRRVYPGLVVIAFWVLVGLPLYMLIGLARAEGADVAYPALALKAPLQELFAILLAQNFLYLPLVRHEIARLAPRLRPPVVSLVRFQTSFIGLLLIATAGTVLIVQGRSIERDERTALSRLDHASAELAAAELSSTLHGYATALAVAGGLWPGLSPAAREARARAALESGHFQLFAWLDPGLHVQGGWRAADGGKAAHPATSLDIGTLESTPLAPGPLEGRLLLVTSTQEGRPPSVLVLHRLPGNAGYLAGGISLQTLAKRMQTHIEDQDMTLELQDARGRVLAQVAVTRPPRSLANLPGLPGPAADLVQAEEVPASPWRVVARTPGWVLQQRVNITLWHALPPLLLLLALLGAMGAAIMVVLRQELGQISKSTLQLGRLATEEAVGDPVFEESFLAEVERLNGVYQQVADKLRGGFETLRKRDAELSLANAQLASLVDTLKAMDRNRAEVMNAISHDIKIPLTAVIGYTELLEDQAAGPLNTEQAEYVKNIEENSQRVVRLLEDLLDFARLEVGRFPIDAQEIELAPALQRTLRNLQPLVDARGLDARVEAAPELPPAWVDPRRLDQVLNNLLSNAIKFTAPGGHIWLKALLSSDGDELLIQVVDTGRGIAPEHLARLFERFYRVPGSTEPGTGLGLAISRKLVEAMGGHMGVLSEPGKGSTFWLTLPRADQSRSAAPATRAGAAER